MAVPVTVAVVVVLEQRAARATPKSKSAKPSSYSIHSFILFVGSPFRMHGQTVLDTDDEPTRRKEQEFQLHFEFVL